MKNLTVGIAFIKQIWIWWLHELFLANEEREKLERTDSQLLLGVSATYFERRQAPLKTRGAGYKRANTM